MIRQTLSGEDISTTGEEAPSELLFEALFFCLHLIDRISFGILGSEQRDIFVDGLLFTLATGFSRTGVDVEAIRQAYNERHSEYGRYKRLLGGKGESLSGTLCWEFAKRLAADAGVRNPVTIDVLAIGAAECVITLGGLLKDPEVGVLRDCI